LAAGQSVSGQLVEHVSTDAAFYSAAVAGMGMAGLVWTRRHTLMPAHPVTRPLARAAG